jgi:hypothetical protein
VKFAQINNGILQVVPKLDRSVVINTFECCNNINLDLVPSESPSLVDDIDYDFWNAALVHPFKANMNWKLYKDAYLIPNSLSTLTCPMCTLAKSQPNVPNPVDSKSTEVFK